MLIPGLFLILWLQICPLSGEKVGDQNMINNIIEFMIEQLTAKFPQLVSLGNITSPHLFGATRFEAAFGTLNSLHSLQRSGDVTIDTSEHTISVTLKVTFNRLEVIYEEYKLSVMGMSTSGRLETTALENLFKIVASISDQSECFVTLMSFDVLSLGNFKVKLFPSSGNRFVGSWGSSVVTRAVNFFKEKIRVIVETEVRKVIQSKITPSKFVCVKFLEV